MGHLCAAPSAERAAGQGQGPCGVEAALQTHSELLGSARGNVRQGTVADMGRESKEASHG